MEFLWAIYIYFLRPLLSLYFWVIIINAVMSWLVAFNVINRNNQIVEMIGRFTYAVTEPALRPIRRFIPPIGGLDITPIILILAVIFVRDWLLIEVIGAIAGPPALR